MQQPQKLLAALKSNFGPQAGETAFMMSLSLITEQRLYVTNLVKVDSSKT